MITTKRALIGGAAALVAAVLGFYLILTNGYLPESVILNGLENAVADSLTRDDLADQPDGLHVMLCGAGSPLPDINRSGPCIAVQAGERLYIVDAGTNGARNLGRFFVDAGRVEAVFLTHVHSDHIDGLGELGLIRWSSSGSDTPLPVYGPPIISEVVAGFNRAYAPDVAYRVLHQPDDVSATGGGLEASPFDLPAEGELKTVLETPDGVRVSAFKVDHWPVDEAVGYRIDYKGLSVAISGDTKKSANLIEHSRGVDLLLHEALDSRLTERIAVAAESVGDDDTAKTMRDIGSYHATPVQAAESAAEAGAAHLVYYHIAPQLPNAAMERLFLKGTSDVYDGKITVATDGTLITMPVEE